MGQWQGLSWWHWAPTSLLRTAGRGAKGAWLQSWVPGPARHALCYVASFRPFTSLSHNPTSLLQWGCHSLTHCPSLSSPGQDQGYTDLCVGGTVSRPWTQGADTLVSLQWRPRV